VPSRRGGGRPHISFSEVPPPLSRWHSQTWLRPWTSVCACSALTGDVAAEVARAGTAGETRARDRVAPPWPSPGGGGPAAQGGPVVAQQSPEPSWRGTARSRHRRGLRAAASSCWRSADGKVTPGVVADQLLGAMGRSIRSLELDGLSTVPPQSMHTSNFAVSRESSSPRVAAGRRRAWPRTGRWACAPARRRRPCAVC